jgi:type IV pilus assembly protein PilB
MIIAQRLLRQICRECKIPYEVSVAEMAALGVTMNRDSGSKVGLMKGRGCDICHNSGYKGRIGIYEVMEMNEEMRQLVVNRAPPSEIRTAAARTGMASLRDGALKKMLAGFTTIEEVIRVTVAEESLG